MQVGTVSSIFLYPIKSVGGVAVDSAYVESDGLAGDRRFAFMDEESGRLCSAKHPRKFGAMLRCTARYVSPPEPGSVLPVLEVEFPDGSLATNSDGELDWRMSQFLGRPVRLVSHVGAGVTNEIVWPDDVGIARTSVYSESVEDAYGDHVATYRQAPGSRFVDLSPVHLITTSSIEFFGSHNPTSNFDPRRYRPTMLLDTKAQGLVEEGWVDHIIEIGDRVKTRITLAAPRCVMTTLEHAADVPADKGSLRTIVQLNTHEVVGRGRWACAGVYADVEETGIVNVGDPVFRHVDSDEGTARKGEST